MTYLINSLSEQLFFLDQGLTTFRDYRTVKTYSNKKIGSNETYDTNTDTLAKPISVIIRTLVHDTGKSTSLLKHLGIKESIKFIDSADQLNSYSSISVSGNSNLTIEQDKDEPKNALLVSKVINATENYIAPHYLNHLEDWYKSYPRLDFEDWWTAIVYKGEYLNPTNMKKEELTITREELVKAIANNDGGAHIDKDLKLEKNYVKLKQEDLLYNINGEIKQLDRNFAYASLMQIGWELLNSIDIKQYGS